MSEEVLCFRCGLVRTRKRVDGKPVCGICFLADARANHGIQPDYHDLTPVGRGRASIPQAEVTPDIIAQVKPKRRSTAKPKR